MTKPVDRLIITGAVVKMPPREYLRAPPGLALAVIAVLSALTWTGLLAAAAAVWGVL
jgi:hypothetical protein